MEHSDKKIKIIYFLTTAIEHLRGPCYEGDLIRLRQKYIYKDISPQELKVDVLYLKDIKEIIRRSSF